MVSRASWNGTVDDCAKGLQPLLRDGRIRYSAGCDDPLDEEWLAVHAEKVKALFAEIPKGNGKYSMFVRTVLHIMDSEEFEYKDVPKTRKAKLEEAEDVAATLRTICFHIRREWYRKSSKPLIVQYFPRPSKAAPPAVPDVEVAPPAVPDVPVPAVGVDQPAAALMAASHRSTSDLDAFMFLCNPHRVPFISIQNLIGV